MYRLSSGIPSGTAFTALINSIINFLVLSRICHDVFGIVKNQNVRFSIGGDDFLVFFRNLPVAEKIWTLEETQTGYLNTGIIIEKFKEFAAREFGMELKLGTFSKPYPEQLKDCPSFYKTCIWRDLPTIRQDHLYEKLVAPNSMIRGKWDFDLFCNTLFAQPPAPFAHLMLLVKLMVYIKRSKEPWLDDNFDTKETYSLFKLLWGRFRESVMAENPNFSKLTFSSDSQKRRPAFLCKSVVKKEDTANFKEVFFGNWKDLIPLGIRPLRAFTVVAK